MRKIKLPTDRTVFSTDNNGYAGEIALLRSLV